MDGRPREERRRSEDPENPAMFMGIRVRGGVHKKGGGACLASLHLLTACQALLFRGRLEWSRSVRKGTINAKGRRSHYVVLFHFGPGGCRDR